MHNSLSKDNEHYFALSDFKNVNTENLLNLDFPMFKCSKDMGSPGLALAWCLVNNKGLVPLALLQRYKDKEVVPVILETAFSDYPVKNRGTFRVVSQGYVKLSEIIECSHSEIEKQPFNISGVSPKIGSDEIMFSLDTYSQGGFCHFKEYQVKLRDYTKTADIDMSKTDSVVDVKQYIPSGIDLFNYSKLITNTNGIIYSQIGSPYTDDDNMVIELRYKSPKDTEVIGGLNFDKGQFSNLDKFFYTDNFYKSIYSETDNPHELKLMEDYAKNETITIKLPDGYITADIVKVYHDTDDIIVLFRDNSVYYSKNADIETLKYDEDLNKFNKNGALNNMQYANGEYIVLSDDGIVYKVDLK